MPAAALTGFLLLYGFFRSDFVAMIAHGQRLGAAYAASKRYFQAPMIMWFTTWALVLACRDLPEAKAEQPLRWAGLGRAGPQTPSRSSNRSAVSACASFSTTCSTVCNRPEMLVVRTSNLNTVLMLLFWPSGLLFHAEAQLRRRHLHGGQPGADRFRRRYQRPDHGARPRPDRLPLACASGRRRWNVRASRRNVSWPSCPRPPSWPFRWSSAN
ncbi:MAG: hypothetical protein WDN06_18240 [Asticcacaulis sp.]